MDVKVCISICTNRLIKPKTVQSLGTMITQTKYPLYFLMATEGYTVAENRNYSVIKAIENKCTHILFIDDDMTFPADTLEKLMSSGKEIIGVNSHSRTLPLTTTVALLKDGEHWAHDHVPPYWKMPTEIFEVFSIGMGVALIDLSVFDNLEKPWFKFDVHPSGKILIGEDAWFCKQARERGYKVWCDPTLEIGHIGDYTY